MPSKHRFRLLAALCAFLMILIAPQPAGAGTSSSSKTQSASQGHIHRKWHRHLNGSWYRERHNHRSHHHRRPETPPTTTPPTPVPTPVPVPVPVPTPTPSPVAGECLNRNPLARISGAQGVRFKPGVEVATAIDARGASWTQVDDWPVSITGSGPVCWSGGSIAGTWGPETSWETFHGTGGFSIANPNSIVENVRVHNYGDAINIRNGAIDWRVRGAYTTMTHDDCLQDDYLNAGVVSDSLFDGCYVGISTRPSKSDTGSDGRTKTVTVETTLLRLQPMPTVYKGQAPGHGGLFKWDTAARRSPMLVLRNNIFRVDQAPNHGSLGLPEGYEVTCSGNTIVWLGSGAFPDEASWRTRCPDTRIVTTRSVWDNAVNAWHAAR